MQKVIALDFDGTLCQNAWPEIGAPNTEVISAALREQKNGAALVLWTCREGELLEQALDACRKWGLEFDAVNDSIPEWKDAFGNSPRKIGASEYWDDKAVNPLKRVVDGPAQHFDLDFLPMTIREDDNGCFYSLTRKQIAAFAKATDEMLLDAIVKKAKENGITYLYVLNEDFILEAIREKMGRENEAQWVPFVPPLSAGDVLYRCSKCHRTADGGRTPHCPQCGAKMDLG